MGRIAAVSIVLGLIAGCGDLSYFDTYDLARRIRDMSTPGEGGADDLVMDDGGAADLAIDNDMPINMDNIAMAPQDMAMGADLTTPDDLSQVD
jgi:hypothetical protein